MQPSRIPFRDVLTWCEHEGLDYDETAFVDACVRALDAEYLDWHALNRGNK